jgi:hypothetical protein
MDDNEWSGQPSTSRSIHLFCQVKNVIHGNCQLTVQEVTLRGWNIYWFMTHNFNRIFSNEQGLRKISAKILD